MSNPTVRQRFVFSAATSANARRAAERMWRRRSLKIEQISRFRTSRYFARALVDRRAQPCVSQWTETKPP